MRFIIFLILTLASSSTLAQKEAPKIVSNPYAPTGLAAADLSTSPVSSTIDVDGYALLKLQVRFVGDGAATNIGATCEESDDATTWSKVTKIAPDDAVTEFHPLYTTGASLNFTIRLDVTGFINVRCTFSGTGATGADKVTVIARRVRGI